MTRPTSSAPDSLLRDLLAVVDEPVLLLDADRRVAAVAGPVAPLLGMEGELVGRSLRDPDAPEPLAALDRLLSAEAGPFDAVLRWLAVAGAEREVGVRVRAARGGAGAVTGWAVRLVAAEGAAEDGLRRLAAEHLPCLVALYREDGRCAYLGEGSGDALGYTPDELRALRACELLHPADAEAQGAALAPGQLGETPLTLVLRVRRRGGEYAWLEATLRSVRHASLGALVHVTARDVTAQRRAEEALRWLGSQTKLVLDSAADGIFGVDPQGSITFVNPAASRMLGVSVSELMGAPYPKDPGAADDIAATLSDGLPRAAGDRSWRRPDGSVLEVEYTCTPARMHDTLVGAVVTFRDAADRRRAEALLRRAEWLAGVEQTAIALRHEINNPLTALLAEAELLQSGLCDPEEQREMVATIAAQARRVAEVVRRLAERQGDPAVRTDALGSMLDLSR